MIHVVIAVHRNFMVFGRGVMVASDRTAVTLTTDAAGNCHSCKDGRLQNAKGEKAQPRAKGAACGTDPVDQEAAKHWNNNTSTPGEPRLRIKIWEAGVRVSANDTMGQG